jgi:hypothetical protein
MGRFRPIECASHASQYTQVISFRAEASYSARRKSCFLGSIDLALRRSPADASESNGHIRGFGTEVETPAGMAAEVPWNGIAVAHVAAPGLLEDLSNYERPARRAQICARKPLRSLIQTPRYQRAYLHAALLRAAASCCVGSRPYGVNLSTAAGSRLKPSRSSSRDIPVS